LQNRVDGNHLEYEMPVKSLCPGCREMVRFFIINAGSAQEGDWTGELWMHPSPSARRAKPVFDLLPPDLVGTYHDAIESYHSGIWRGAIGQARVVLEGVVKTLLSDIEGSPVDPRVSLAQLFDRLADKKDLATPIKDVSQVMRAGGNIASHFEAGREISTEMATEMLDLLDAFLDYLLLLPEQVERLRKRLEQAP
jgi:hypothetical protein